ncbi:MAG: metallophosphoesterase family protein [Candidatus Nitrosocaldaceae archaeon]
MKLEDYMRVLVFSDLHGDESLIKKVKELSNSADISICCGDITPIRGNTREIAKKIGRLGIELFIVPGNFELPKELDSICEEYEWHNIHGKSVKIDRLTIGGCGGAIKGPYNTPYEINEQEMNSILEHLTKLDILVTHSPPKGATDNVSNLNIGSDSIRRFIQEMNPTINLCGHVHENGGNETLIYNTRVINIARQVKIIDL